jgi:4-alpha-glucanotransferase
MNIPGKASGNWQWRLEENALSKKLYEKRGFLTSIHAF